MATSEKTMEVEMNKHKTSSSVVLALLGERNAFSFYILFSLWGLCTFFYYFGELVDFAGWEALRWGFFYGVHDIHRLFFLAPITYAGYVFGIRAAVIITIITIMTFLPRALFISPFPNPLLRTVLFTLIAGTLSYLAARVRTESKRRSRLETMLVSERDTLLGILDRLTDGVLIVGPDYRIRFMNPQMAKDFGKGVGAHCYECLQQRNEPCPEICKLPEVIGGQTEKWRYQFPNGQTYEVLASPYVDSDGVVCQLTRFKKITRKAASKPTGPN